MTTKSALLVGLLPLGCAVFGGAVDEQSQARAEVVECR